MILHVLKIRLSATLSSRKKGFIMIALKINVATSQDYYSLTLIVRCTNRTKESLILAIILLSRNIIKIQRNYWLVK